MNKLFIFVTVMPMTVKIEKEKGFLIFLVS